MLKRPVYLWRFFYIYRGEIIGKRNFLLKKQYYVLHGNYFYIIFVV